MTRDELRDLVLEAGIDWHKHWNDDGSNRLEHLATLIAALVAASEREACAKVCEEAGLFHEVSHGADLAFDLAEAIRARGKE
jgi:hypothetical protein